MSESAADSQCAAFGAGVTAPGPVRSLRRYGARRFFPSRWGSAFERDRAAWFDQVRPSPALHRPQQLS
jgi:hypothetical protein